MGVIQQVVARLQFFSNVVRSVLRHGAGVRPVRLQLQLAVATAMTPVLGWQCQAAAAG